MADFTPNYNIRLPAPNESMKDVNLFLTNPFKAFEKAANPTIVSTSALPQSGHKVFDRIYCSAAGYESCFILLSNEPNWGYIWRPVQSAISPWYDIPATAIQDSDYELHPTYKLQIALDNMGHCYWRGAIRKKIAGLPNGDSKAIFHTLPNGLRHHTDGIYHIAIDPVTGTSDTGLNAFKGGRFFIRTDGYTSFRFNGGATAQNIFMNSIEYPCSEGVFWSP